MTDTRNEVEAVLLNSQGDPEAEVEAALCGVVRFALLECEYTAEGLQQALAKALKIVREEGIE